MPGRCGNPLWKMCLIRLLSGLVTNAPNALLSSPRFFPPCASLSPPPSAVACGVGGCVVGGGCTDDISHNCYVQIKGRKRVVIFPPESWQTLYLHPIVHPGGLGAQVQ